MLSRLFRLSAQFRPPRGVFWPLEFIKLSFREDDASEARAKLRIFHFFARTTLLTPTPIICRHVMLLLRSTLSSITCTFIDGVGTGAVEKRKKTDNPREGWEDGTPPPHRDFKEGTVWC